MWYVPTFHQYRYSVQCHIHRSFAWFFWIHLIFYFYLAELIDRNVLLCDMEKYSWIGKCHRALANGKSKSIVWDVSLGSPSILRYHVSSNCSVWCPTAGILYLAVISCNSVMPAVVCPSVFIGVWWLLIVLSCYWAVIQIKLVVRLGMIVLLSKECAGFAIGDGSDE